MTSAFFSSVALPVALLVAGCASSQSEASEASEASKVQTDESAESLIRDVFRDYQGAVAAGDGERAVSHVDQGTIDWYETIVESARTADRSALRRLPFMQKLSVILCRQLFEGKQLANLRGAGLLARLLEEDPFSRAMLEKTVIDSIRVAGDSASATMRLSIDIPATNNEFTFVFETRWKLALSVVIRHAELELAKSFEDATEDEILKAIEQATGRPITADILEPSASE